MLSGIDVATTQRLLDFTKPFAEGYTSCYVKLGGENNPRYESPYYDAQVIAARAAGYRIGHYWVPEDSQDPRGAARYMVANLNGWTKRDFIVLDNEDFAGNDPDGTGPQTDSKRYTDPQCAEFVDETKKLLGIPGDQVFVYSGLSDARGMLWTATLDTGANFIIAAYSYGPFEFQSTLTTIPEERVAGHQTGQRSFMTTAGNTVPVDVNSFKDWAFDYDVPEVSGGLTSEQDALLRKAVADIAAVKEILTNLRFRAE
jgi:hypothetical protein